MTHPLILALAVTCAGAACGLRASDGRPDETAQTPSRTQAIKLTVTRTADVEITVRR